MTEKQKYYVSEVSGIVGRAELLSAVAFLSALLYYIHHRYQHKSNAWIDCSVTSVLAILGLLCKEQALTVLAVCCIYEFSLPKEVEIGGVVICLVDVQPVSGSGNFPSFPSGKTGLQKHLNN
ncbi:transmembrane and TPR repeat-containing protein 3 [Trichonephila clavipes]|nr:transmembrane and TPR repeat-containing protein 3 [Trichonephila clavipes]